MGKDYTKGSATSQPQSSERSALLRQLLRVTQHKLTGFKEFPLYPAPHSPRENPRPLVARLYRHELAEQRLGISVVFRFFPLILRLELGRRRPQPTEQLLQSFPSP